MGMCVHVSSPIPLLQFIIVIYFNLIHFCVIPIFYTIFPVLFAVCNYRAMSIPGKFPTNQTIVFVFEYTCTGVCMCIYMGMCVQTTHHSHNH